MTTTLDRTRVDAIVQCVVDRLPGDWLLVGGALVALWLDTRRVTEDVDLVGLAGTGADRLSLLGLAADLGLPVEALNSAADYFVHQIPDWRQHLELFRTGPAGRIFRPSATLFLLLKVRRLSTRDLEDCLKLIRRCEQDGVEIDTARVRSALTVLDPSADAALTARRARLSAAIDRRSGPPLR